MNKAKAAVIALDVAWLVVIQQRQLSRLAVANHELQQQLEQALGERDELDVASERL